MDDLTDVIDEFASDLVITRYTEGAITSGRVAAPTTSTFAARVAIQPMTERELMQLPEGWREQGAVKGYSPVALQTRPPDRFSHGGATWQVMQADVWNHLAGYWRIIATRVTR